MRYAEGRGVPANLELAAQWFERAAKQGLAPAQYRLGSLYEKGQGVKKDLNKARQLYLRGRRQGQRQGDAQSRGALRRRHRRQARLQHRRRNGSARPRERGVADSQYNLGILYARGIGVDQNLAESYKWFALAAAAGRPGRRPRSATMWRPGSTSSRSSRRALAVQTFAAEPPPDEAMNVKAPAGGWDRAASAGAGQAGRDRRKPQAAVLLSSRRRGRAQSRRRHARACGAFTLAAAS